jgi:hypothetical protein
MLKTANRIENRLQTHTKLTNNNNFFVVNVRDTGSNAWIWVYKWYYISLELFKYVQRTYQKKYDVTTR